MKNLNFRNQALLLIVFAWSSISIQAQSNEAHIVLGIDTTVSITPNLLKVKGKIISEDGFSDADGDTNIELQKFNDDDKIRFRVKDVEVFRIEKNSQGYTLFDTNQNYGNTFFGNQAGNLNGQDSVSAGDGAGNTGFGELALKDNTKGGSNTAVGSNSLVRNISGDSNTAIGAGAMLSNLSGGVNVSFGNSSLQTNSSGSRNCAFGANALSLNDIGVDNVGIGNRAGAFNSSGTRSVYVGNNAGAGGSNSNDEHIKSNNVMIGYNSGQQAQGSNNIFLGYESGKNETGNNKLIIENSDADETNALIYGEFDNDYLRINGQVDIDGAYTLPTNMGSAGQVLHTTGAGAAYWAVDNNGPWEIIGDHLAYEDGRVGIKTTDPSDALHVVGTGTDDLFRVQLNSSTKMRIYNNGSISLGGNNTGITAGDVYVANDLGVGTGSPIRKFHVQSSDSNNAIARIKNTSSNNVAGGLEIELGPTLNPTTTNRFIRLQDGNGTLIGSVTGNGSGGVQYNTTSDRRLKMNIEECNNGLEIIKNINPKVYERISNPGEKEIGFIAQELYKTFPQVVSGTPNSSIDTPMMVDYGQMTPVIVAALKEQQTMIENQQMVIAKLEAQLLKKDAALNNLASEVASIKSMLIK